MIFGDLSRRFNDHSVLVRLLWSALITPVQCDSTSRSPHQLPQNLQFQNKLAKFFAYLPNTHNLPLYLPIQPDRVKVTEFKHLPRSNITLGRQIAQRLFVCVCTEVPYQNSSRAPPGRRLSATLNAPARECFQRMHCLVAEFHHDSLCTCFALVLRAFYTTKLQVQGRNRRPGNAGKQNRNDKN